MARFEMTCSGINTGSYMRARDPRPTNLVDIHVTLSATTGLEHHKREVINEVSGDDLRNKAVRSATFVYEDVQDSHRQQLFGWPHQLWDLIRTQR